MAYLKDLLKQVTYICTRGTMDCKVTHICHDSRQVVRGSMFICLAGSREDGHDYLAQAIRKGAAVCVVSKHVWVEGDVTVIRVRNTSEAMAWIARNYYGAPAEAMQMIGITGTKGKTTTACMLYQMLKEAGVKCGLIGTLGIRRSDGLKKPGSNTTPDALVLQKELREMADAGCSCCVMEVSSQGLKMHRVAGIVFDYGIFTNLSPDHIGPNEHASFEEYQECKSLLFRQCKEGIVNADDEHVDGIIKNHTCKLHTFSCKKDADLMAGAVGYLDEEGQIGMHFTTTGCMNVYAVVHIPGSFSVYNSLVTMLTCHLAGISDEAILRGLDKVKVRGRVELVPVSKDFTVIIDYAHNEVSTRSVLTTLKEYHPKRLICVYGGGGNRSKLRRYDMGEVTGELADLSVLTCDNPRDEEIRDINNDIKIGLAKSNGKYIEIDDRKAAIKYCIENAKKGDMIVLLGKGHEDYQEIKGVKYHFDEREAIAEVKKELNL